MKKLRHILFLKDVLLYTLSAFGGPQGHLMLMMKHFVQKRPYITEKDLIEYNSFCQLIPGPSSTQLLGIIAYKRGGFWLSLFSLLIWILPASILMGALSFFVLHDEYKDHALRIFRFLQPVTLSFLIYSTIRYFKTSINNTITTAILLISTSLTFSFFKTPWIIPALIIFGGLITNFSNKRFPDTIQEKNKITINWKPVLLFLFIFISAGWISETARKNDWKDRKHFNLFENNYRFGSMVFGGGDVLLPLMIDQYVERPTSQRSMKRNPNAIKVEKNTLINGFGIVRAVPGPVFSVSSYIGGIALSDQGKLQQTIGCIIGAASIFLPSLILLFFLIPFWDQIKKQPIVFRSLEGINAAVSGVMLATIIYLLDGTLLHVEPNMVSINVCIISVSTFFLLKTKIPAPLIVFTALIIGWLL